MIKAGLTLAQMVRASRAVKALPKAKIAKLPQMPKKTGWKKPFFPKSKMFPEYSPYDVATDLGATAVFLGGYAGYKKLTNGKKKKKRKT